MKTPVKDHLNEMTGIGAIEGAADTTTGIEIDDDEGPDLGPDLDLETDIQVDEIPGEIEAGPDLGPEIDPDETDTK